MFWVSHKFEMLVNVDPTQEIGLKVGGEQLVRLAVIQLANFPQAYRIATDW